MASIPLAHARSQFARRLPFIQKYPSRGRNPIPTRHLNTGGAAADASHRPKISWLDLRGSGLSAIERLAIEELLLRHDPKDRCWAIVGVHEPTEGRLLRVDLPPHDDWHAQRKRAADVASDVYGHANDGWNRSCAIVMGIGGKAERLIDVDSAKNDGVLVLKRFSGGGTVVVDHSTLWTTFVMRNEALPHVKPFPREIMAWSAEAIFGPAFEGWNREIRDANNEGTTSNNDAQHLLGAKDAPLLGGRKKRGRQTLVFQGKSCGLSGGVGESLMLPPKEKERRQQQSTAPLKFQLRENDYVLGERKIGGNAQSIVGGGFLHHTSFLWDWDRTNMDYLTLPAKRPDYRGDRSHDEFLVRLKDHCDDGGDGERRSTKNSLFGHMKSAAAERFDLEEATLGDALDVADEKFGGLQRWFDGKCRTKVVRL